MKTKTLKEEEEDEEDEEDDDDDDDDEEVYLKTYNGKQYYVTNDENSDVYAVDEDEDVGDIVGCIKKGKFILNTK